MKKTKFLTSSIFRVEIILLLLIFIFGFNSAYAADPWLIKENIKDQQSLDSEVKKALHDISEKPQSEQPEALKELTDEYRQAKSKLDMFGFNFGIGLMGAHFGGKKRVDSASLVNGKIQIDQGDNTTLGVVFEAHNLFWNLYGPLYTGPFLGIQTTTNELLDSAVLGWMFAFKYKDDAKGSFNIGVGWVIDPNTKVLSNDFNEGQPLPSGAQDISTKKVTKTGVGVIVSYGF